MGKEADMESWLDPEAGIVPMTLPCISSRAHGGRVRVIKDRKVLPAIGWIKSQTTGEKTKVAINVGHLIPHGRSSQNNESICASGAQYSGASGSEWT